MLQESQKNNLNKLLERYNFQYLRPPPEVQEIIIPQSQYFVNSSDGPKRKIFFNVQYTAQEIASINQVRAKMHKYNIFQNFTDQLILKHLYVSSMNLQKTFDRLKQVQQFQNDPVIVSLTNETYKRLQSGCIYTFGQDRGMKPIVILKISKFDFNLSVNENMNAVYFLLLVVMGYRMTPYFAEKYVLIFDLQDVKFSSISFSYMYETLTKMSVCFCGNVQKILIYNSSGIRFIWSIISRFIAETSKNKIKFVEEGKQQQVLQFISEFELQKKYGGNLDNLCQFWPPKQTNQFDTKHHYTHQNIDESYYYSVNNDLEYFKDTSNCGCGQCSIY